MSTSGKIGKLNVTSPAFEPGGNLPVEFTCDGAGVSPPIKWEGATTQAKFFALQLWHIPKDGGTKSYWVVYNVPADVTSLPKNAKGIGKNGYNGKRQTGYDPMCSKGPGVKEYHVTVYALSAKPKYQSRHVVDRVETGAEYGDALTPINLEASRAAQAMWRWPPHDSWQETPQFSHL